jgi:hypothetical protein
MLMIIAVVIHLSSIVVLTQNRQYLRCATNAFSQRFTQHLKVTLTQSESQNKALNTEEIIKEEKFIKMMTTTTMMMR